MRVGVIGVGVAGSSHLFDLASSDRFTIAAVCARRRSRAVEAADRYGVALAYDNAADMLTEVSLDAVVIATPPDTAPALARIVLDAGLPALIDKPAATTAGQLERVWTRSGSAPVAVGYNRRYQRHIQRAHDVLADGTLASVTDVSCDWSAPFIRRYTSPDTYRPRAGWGCGVILDTASHILDALTYLGIEPLVAHRARLTRGEMGADVAARIDLRWSPHDIPVSVRIDDSDDDDSWRIMIRTSDGYLTLDRSRLTSRRPSRSFIVTASDTRRPVDDLVDLAEGRPGYGASLPEAITVLAIIDQIRSLAVARRPWLRPRAKALGRLNGAC